MDGHGELDLIAENFDPGIIGRLREDEFDQSRSGSEPFDAASGDDHDPADENDHPRRKKKYHRHTPNQIQELESYDTKYLYCILSCFGVCVFLFSSFSFCLKCVVDDLVV